MLLVKDTNIGKLVENENSFTLGRNSNWVSHSGNQHENSPES